MSQSTPQGSGPLPEFPALAGLVADGHGESGHAVLDAVLTGLRQRMAEGTMPVAYYEDAP
jgi:hypothetical protein